MSALADALHEATQKHISTTRKDTEDSTNTVVPSNFQNGIHNKLHFQEPQLQHDDIFSASHSQFDDEDSEHRLRPDQTSKSLSRIAGFKSPPNTPATRTGPPRSLSFAYSLPGSPNTITKPSATLFDLANQGQDAVVVEDPEFSFSATDSDFRGALEYPTAREHHDRKGKKRERERSMAEDSWNPIRWFQESPKEEKPPIEFPFPSATSQETPVGDTESDVQTQPPEQFQEQSQRPVAYKSDTEQPSHSSFFRRPKRGTSAHDSDSPIAGAKTGALRRAFSVPHSPSDAQERDKQESGGPPEGRAKWSRLRALIPHLVHPDESILPGPSMVTSQAVNITDELITGGLSTLMLKLWFERDEKDHRRIPILFHRLRIRVSDSLHPMQGHRSVFRIECEYANGAARWVVYRELRDFLSLHAHYTVSNVYNRNMDKMPEFPKTSLPYFKFLKKEGREKGDKVGRADFARMQREALETYLIGLIRAVMFHPSSNRLAGFLEISALSIALAQSGGAQHKAGFLRIEPSGSSGGGFGRKSAGWRERKVARWCAIRESYLVVLEEPGELAVWDVFLLDSDFNIERPKRYYRQGLGNLLHYEKVEGEHAQNGDANADGHHRHHHHHHGHHEHHEHHEHLHHAVPQIQLSAPPESDRRSIISSIKTRVSKIFHIEPASPRSVRGSQHGHSDDHDGMSSGTSSASIGSSLPSRAPTPMLDPSTNTNPLQHHDHAEDVRQDHASLDPEKRKKNGSSSGAKKKISTDVSKHTFYIVNSQTRLKIIARNEVGFTALFPFSFLTIFFAVKRQMLQFITALEKTAATSHYTGSNRFNSFAPIRLNVAAQWLVDGPGSIQSDDTNRQQRLVGLHPNVMVQRSPSHFQTGTFYWAHHEKVCVIDQTIAFMGGLDLCFGRWDTPQHALTDDTADTDNEEIWPGKDYSNPRLSDFYNLNKPEEDMYDRTKVPRMPWHDVAMQIVGQPARDLARHFVQRTSVNDVKIENNIGDAIVHRIIRAHRDRTPWKCCILIPLMPGFTFPVDHSDASAIRIILECQNRTLARGPNSIFSRLRKEGIDPDEHISVFSLRNWGKMRGEVLTTEQVYIHAKVCIVDDRLAIIGSANINERSQRGDRDSEVAAVIRDTDLIDSTMAGKPFKVGRFAHTLRVRLMREHLGIDVDALDEEDLMTHEPVKPEFEQTAWDPDEEQIYSEEHGATHVKKSNQKTSLCNMASTKQDATEEAAYATKVAHVLHRMGFDQNSGAHDIGEDVLKETRKDYNREGQKETGFDRSAVPTLEEKIVAKGSPPEDQIADDKDNVTVREEAIDERSPSQDRLMQDEQFYPTYAVSDLRTDDRALFKAPANAQDATVDKEPPPSLTSDVNEEEQAAPGARVLIRNTLGSKSTRRHAWTVPTKKPKVEPQDFEDPISDTFWKNIWVASAVHNTEIFRKVFHAVPDDLVTTWKQYKEFVAYHDRLSKPTRDSNSGEPVARVPSESGDDEATHVSHTSDTTDMTSQISKEVGEDMPTTPANSSSFTASQNEEQPPKPRRPTRGSEPFEKWERDEMERLLGELNGQLGMSLQLLPN
ncbi:hypothetical protein NLJ89_g2876 [Agrocybe chaxingu]|uniref:Phospholipase n=1 Tax=Agrocybe chaxingu TaxID=84603 RepID=A0A9W8KAM1_9AGAR|nr:hypothetical protein NLJ89_g2876 [Agrocybe chaxingu]